MLFLRFFRGQPAVPAPSLIFYTDARLPWWGPDWSDITNDVPLSNILIAGFLHEDITHYYLQITITSASQQSAWIEFLAGAFSGGLAQEENAESFEERMMIYRGVLWIPGKYKKARRPGPGCPAYYNAGIMMLMIPSNCLMWLQLYGRAPTRPTHCELRFYVLWTSFLLFRLRRTLFIYFCLWGCRCFLQSDQGYVRGWGGLTPRHRADKVGFLDSLSGHDWYYS